MYADDRMKCELPLIDVNGMNSFECGCQVGYHLNRSNFQQCEGILLHVQGVKQSVCLFVVIVVSTKIARSHTLGICVLYIPHLQVQIMVL